MGDAFVKFWKPKIDPADTRKTLVFEFLRRQCLLWTMASLALPVLATVADSSPATPGFTEVAGRRPQGFPALL